MTKQPIRISKVDPNRPGQTSDTPESDRPRESRRKTLAEGMQRAISRSIITTLEESYARTSNVLDVWEAIHEISMMSTSSLQPEEYPGWIKVALSNIAHRLMDLDPSKGAPERLLKDALGVRDMKEFSSRTRLREKYAVYQAVCEERAKRKRGEKVNIFADVAKRFNIGTETAKAWHQDIREITKADDPTAPNVHAESKGEN
jgi:hypothetical protein